MKVAFHFNADHEKLGVRYGYEIMKRFLKTVLCNRALNISTKIFVGDLLIHNLAIDNKEIKELIERWIPTEACIWKSLEASKVLNIINKNIYVVCAESITLSTAEYLNKELKKYEFYIGAFEVDDAYPVHWALYSNSLIPSFRIINYDLSIFYDEISTDERDRSLEDLGNELGFKKIEYENLKGRYTIFDPYDDYEHARRIAEWKVRCGDLLAFIADDVASRLSDCAPMIGDKLWAALKTFDDAETNEQLAQVTASCRRLIEYVADSVFPPADGEHDGHKLGKNDYRNRLMAYADIEKKSNTNIDLIAVQTNILNDQIEKLSKLANKGIHSEVYRYETRRCLLRTILLLDDMLSLKARPFEVKVDLNITGVMSDLYDRPK